MAAGDFLIQTNSLSTDIVPDAGSGVLKSTWDFSKINKGNTIGYNINGEFTLSEGVYLIMYSEKFITTNTSNNTRFQINGEIHEVGIGAIGGYSGDFIRKASGHQEAILTGRMLLEVGSGGSSYFIQFERTDSSTSGTCNRETNNGSVQILQLNNNDNYGFYSISSPESTNLTNIRTLNLNVTDRQNLNIVRTTNTVTINNSGRYLMTYSLDVSQVGNGREDVISFLEKNNTTPVVGSYGYAYLRAAENTKDSALTWIGIVDVTSGDSFKIQWQCPTNGIITCTNAKFQIWEIPSIGTEVITESTTGNFDSGIFEYDTVEYIDSSSFSANNNQSNINVLEQGYVLSFATFSKQNATGPQRGYPESKFVVNGIVSNIASDASYHRASGGSGAIAQTVASILEIPLTNSTIEVRNDTLAASGTLTNTSGQISILSLDSIFGQYSLPPVILNVNISNNFIWSINSIEINGGNFENLQGTGYVEIWNDLNGTIKQQQTIANWSDNQVIINPVQGSLPDNTNVYVLINTNSNNQSTLFNVNVGFPTYDAVLNATNPDHKWNFNGNYLDTGFGGITNNASVDSGNPLFLPVPLTRSATSSFAITGQSQRIEAPDSPFMNTGVPQPTRSMGGWIRISQVQDSFVCFYEEGGGVNNLAFLMGIGGILIAQLADTGDDNVHAYSDFKLSPNRDYHILFRYDYTTTQLFELLIDGVLQSSTFGNPLTATDLDAHSGDIGWGDAEGTLEVFGTDILFPAAVTSYYQYWVTYRRFVSNSEARVTFFELGAREDIKISTNTESNMQLDFNSYINDIYNNSSLTFKIEICTDGDFTLIADNIILNEFTSIHAQYTGTDTLVLINKNGSNFNINKISTPYGGTVIIRESVSVKITVRDISNNNLITGAAVILKAETEGNFVEIIRGDTDINGEIETNVVFISDLNVEGTVRKYDDISNLYKQSKIVSQIKNNGLNLTIFLIKE